jgi:hypothetical protein
MHLEEGLEEVAGDTLDGIVNGQHVYPLAVLDVWAGRHLHHIAKAHLPSSRIVSTLEGQEAWAWARAAVPERRKGAGAGRDLP